MAIYKGREVRIERIEDTKPITGSAVVSYRDGTVERVELNALQLTSDEKSKIEKDHNLNMTTANTVSDKDVKNIRDAQDPEKIKKQQDKQEVKTQTPTVPNQVKTKNV